MTQSPGQIWATLDRMSDAYAEQHGAAPNQLRVGSQVAALLRSPEDSPGHPLHTHWTRTVAPRPGETGAWFPMQPTRERRWWDQWLRERSCRRYMGGHWWHPADPMIAWFCCVCGRERDGIPKDGT